MRASWRTFFYAAMAVAVLVGLDYGYRIYLRPMLEGPGAETAAEGPPVILELTKGSYFAEFGSPTAPTKVVGYVPDESCHNEAIKFLVGKAGESPNDLYVKLIRMYTAEGMQALAAEGKDMCARYEINGKSALAIRRPDHSAARVQFERAPARAGTQVSHQGRPADLWTVDDLALAIEQAQSGVKDVASSVAQPLEPQGPDEQGVATPGSPPAAVGGHQPHPSLAAQLLGDRSVGEWGDPGAPTQVVCYVPESLCHDECVRFLIDEVGQSPSQLHVRLVRMNTPEGRNIVKKERGNGCAAYLINGQSTMTVMTPQKIRRQVTFEYSPATGSFALQDLESAVQEAMAKSAAKG